MTIPSSSIPAQATNSLNTLHLTPIDQVYSQSGKERAKLFKEHWFAGWWRAIDIDQDKGWEANIDKLKFKWNAESASPSVFSIYLR